MFAAVLLQGVPGLVLCVQTSGESLNFNIHLHGMLTAGVFESASNFHQLSRLDQDKLSQIFCHHVLCALQERGLITETVVAQILGQRHSGFSVWIGEGVSPDDQDYRLFLARYIDRGPVADSRIEIVDDVVTYHTDKDGLTHEFSALEFLARLTPHIPRKWESTIRYYGHYSHRARGKRNRERAKREKANSEVPAINILPALPEQKAKASKSWAALIKRIFEIDPLVCPRCKSSMAIKAFITETAQVKRLLKNLEIPGFEKPQPIFGPSPPSSLIYEPEYMLNR